MPARNALAIAVVFTTFALFASRSPARQQPGGLGENAALRYWQAFAHMPQHDEAQRKLLADALAPGAEPDADARKLVESGRDALLYLRRGAAIGPCDWGLHPEDGPHLLLPHLAKGRDLARLACLRARQSFAGGDPRRAVDDAADAVVLARHLSADLTAMISYLVQINVERMAVETLAADLGGLDAAALDHLGRRLAALPPGGSLGATLRVERESFYDWAVRHLSEMKDEDAWKETVLRPMSDSPEKLDEIVAASGGTREGVLKQLEAFRPYYDEVGALLPLPREQFHAKLAELEKRYHSNPIAKAVMPAFAKVYDRDAAGRTRLALLEAAVAVARGGPERVKGFKDAGGAPIEYHETAGGFELHSKVVDEDKPVTLAVGGKRGR